MFINSTWGKKKKLRTELQRTQYLKGVHRKMYTFQKSEKTEKYRLEIYNFD